MTTQPDSDEGVERRRTELAAGIAAHRRHSTGYVTDVDVIVTREGDEPQLAVLFAHPDFPGVRFGHRFPPDDTGTEEIYLKEEIETGALDRMMADPPAPDSAGIVWTTWGDPAAPA